METPQLAMSGFSMRALTRADAEQWLAYLALPGALHDTSWEVSQITDLDVVFDQLGPIGSATKIRFAIIEIATNVLCGTIGFNTISYTHKIAELSCDVHPAYWGRGIGGAAYRALLDWAFASLTLNRVQATILESNVGSLKIAHRCGLIPEGMLRAYRIVRGEPRDFYICAALAPHIRATRFDLEPVT